MKKRVHKLIAFWGIVFLVIQIALYLFVISDAIKAANVKKYVLGNRDELTVFAKALYDNQDNELEIYYSSDEIPESVRKTIDPFDDLKVRSVDVMKGAENTEDRVVFYLGYQPIDHDYYYCGMYFSPTDTLSDIYGRAKGGDYYEYDGASSQEKYRYKAKKICDSWYYFEEAVW